MLGHKQEIVTNVDYQRAVVLGSKRLVKCIARSSTDPKTKNIKYHLQSLKLEDGVKPAQVRQVIKLKPVAISICNRSTVTEVGPLQFWHVSLLGLLGKKRVDVK